MNGRRVLLAAAMLLFGSRAARADQCAWIPADTADKAAALIRESGSVIHWCQPCGDARSSRVDRVRTVDVRRTHDESMREVYVNDNAEDLAYLYVQVSPGEFRNVSKLVGCESSGVSSDLSLGPDGRGVPSVGKPKTLVGIVRGVEEGRHARCIVESESGQRIEFHLGKDFHGRCRQGFPRPLPRCLRRPGASQLLRGTVQGRRRRQGAPRLGGSAALTDPNGSRPRFRWSARAPAPSGRGSGPGGESR
jgi:hypothetical protein